MIRSYMKMQGTQICALDGEIGKLKDVYFDDRNWSVQYFIVELGSWFSGKDVLVSPALVSPFDGTSLKVLLTKRELKACSNADSAIPVSLQQRYHQRALFNLIGTSGCFMGSGPVMVPPIQDSATNAIWDDPHLWSCKGVSRYEIFARDGEVGSNQDMLIDDSHWVIRFIVAAISPDVESQQKLYDPKVIEDIEWALEKVNISENRNKVCSGQHFDATRHLDISYEMIVKDM